MEPVTKLRSPAVKGVIVDDSVFVRERLDTWFALNASKACAQGRPNSPTRIISSAIWTTSRSWEHQRGQREANYDSQNGYHANRSNK